MSGAASGDSDGVPRLPAILMCGGRGTRLDADAEKPLVEVGGEPMVGRVVRALAGSRADAIHAVCSPHAPATEAYLRGLDRDALEVRVGAGDGYVADLDAALERAGAPAVTVASDLPLLEPGHVDDAIATAVGSAATGTGEGAVDPSPPVDSLAVCVPAALKRRLGVSVDTAFEHGGREVAPTGLNVVGDGERVAVREDAALAVNVNRPGDLAAARERAGRESGGR